MRNVDLLIRACVGAVIVGAAAQAGAITRLVPDDYADIRLALAASNDGDVVLVQPGRYTGRLNFESKNVTLASTDGAAVTVIEGSTGDTITIGPGGSIGGFTITRMPGLRGTAVSVGGAGTRIHDNIFEGNREDTFAAGIAAIGASAHVVRNLFRDNTCSQFALVEFGNEAEPIISNNVFANNRCTALEFLVPNQPQASTITNNTFVGNDVGLSFFSFQAFSSMHVLRNNLIVGNGTGVLRTRQFSAGLPQWENNLVFGNTTDYEDMPSQTGVSGNISVNPRFVNPGSGNYRLRDDSPAIDAGHTDGPLDDFDGNARPLDGNGDQIAVNDIGAFEFVPAAVPTRTATATRTIVVPPPTPTAVVGGPFGPFPAGASLFVDQRNTASADGSALRPFRRIQDAIDATTQSVAIGVAAGTYQEAIILRSGIELLGGGADRTTIDGGDFTAVRSADRVRIDGFRIISSVAQFGRGVVECEEGATEIANSSIVGSRVHAILARACNMTIRASRVVAADGPPCFCNGITTFNGALTVIESTIEGTDESGNGSAIEINGGSYSIEKNRIRGRTFIASGPQGGSLPNRFVNNFITSRNGFSEAVSVVSSEGLIANNTMIGGGGVTIQGDLVPEIVNNIIAFGRQGIDALVSDRAPVFAQVRHNDVFSNGTFNESRNYTPGFDQTGINGNISVDPLLVNAESGDPHVTCRSPVVDAGVTIEDLVDDIDGEPRPFDGNGDQAVQVDIGADEFVLPRAPRTWRVPTDFATPSAALIGAVPCDEIVVGAGTYNERLDFAGRDVTVRSATGPQQTRLLPADGAIEIGPLGELRGFTIANGAGRLGPTVLTHGNGSVIRQNWFDGGAAADDGFSGIGIVDAETTIERNRFGRSRCADETPSALISITRGSARVVNNVIADSNCNGIEAGGDLLLLHNTIVANRIGVSWLDPGGRALPSGLANIIVDNDVGIDAEAQPGFPFSNWGRNLVFGNQANYVDSPNLTGQSGNLSVDPSFVDARAGNYHLRADSPAIDAGAQDFFPIVVDFDGQTRPIDGDGDQVAQADIGAFELQTCVGDCDGNSRVSVDELVTGVSISLERAPLDRCARFDVNGDGRVSIDELVRAVNSALLGCA